MSASTDSGPLHAREEGRDAPSAAAPATRVLVLVNRKAGLSWSFDAMRSAMDRYWDVPGTDLVYQFCQDAEDGQAKARRAVTSGFQTVLVVGGDGTVNTVGRALIQSDLSLGVIPAGSGNGFARHFEIPLAPEAAVRSLADSAVNYVDVGMVNDIPFFVTCSMAWDASLVRSFDKSPIRGVIPYIFAGVQEFFQYEPQEMIVDLDGRTSQTFPDPLVFTIANLTQYGGGARIAPHARPDDGRLELVVALRQDIPALIANLGRLFDGSIARVPEVLFRRFHSLRVRRAKAAPIQIDGELVDAPAELNVKVLPGALKVLVPRPSEAPAPAASIPPDRR